MRGISLTCFILAATICASLAQVPASATSGALPPAQAFDGTESQKTTPFTIGDKWEVRFHSSWGTCNVSVLAADGTVVAGGTGVRSAFYVPRGGTYTLQVDFHLRPLTNMAQPSPPVNQNQSPTPFQDTINRGFNDGNQQNSNPSPNNGSQGQNGSVAGENSQLQAQQKFKHWWVEVVEMSSPSALSPDGLTLAMPNYALPGTTGDAAPTSIASPSSSPSNVHIDSRVAYFTRKSDPSSTQAEDTPSFTVTSDEWHMHWSTAKAVKITLVPDSGPSQVAVDDTDAFTRLAIYPPGEGAGTTSDGMLLGHRTYHLAGTFHFSVEGAGAWQIDVSKPQSTTDASTPAVASTPDASTNTPAAIPTTPPPETVKLTEDQARAVVLIKGDNAQGTGFMIKTMDGPAVITNIHVIANNPNLKITTNTGALVTVLSEKGASDRDLALLSIQDAGYNYLQFSGDISKDVQPGDEVITPGNSEGGEVMLNTGGKVLGIGPVRIEFDNPIYHGNSGGPVFHPKSGKVLGVVTEAIKVDTTDDLDKVSFANRNSAISGAMRYFGLRIDTVSAWIPIDSRRFQIETTFLDEFHEQSRRLDAYLNHSENDRDQARQVYHADEKIMKANDNYLEHSSGSDTAQHIDLIRSLVFDLQCVADLDMEQIKDKTNFYSFDQGRAQDEYDYRKALKSELDSISNNVERASFLPRSND